MGDGGGVVVVSAGHVRGTRDSCRGECGEWDERSW